MKKNSHGNKGFSLFLHHMQVVQQQFYSYILYRHPDSRALVIKFHLWKHRSAARINFNRVRMEKFIHSFTPMSAPMFINVSDKDVTVTIGGESGKWSVRVPCHVHQIHHGLLIHTYDRLICPGRPEFLVEYEEVLRMTIYLQTQNYISAAITKSIVIYQYNRHSLKVI